LSSGGTGPRTSAGVAEEDEGGPVVGAGIGPVHGSTPGRAAKYRLGAAPNSEPVGVHNLIATILHTLCDVGELRLVPGLARELATMCSWAPIPGLLG
jgi:hypothetical protein